MYIYFSFRRFSVVSLPKLAPRPLQTGPALKMVQNARNISPGSHFYCQFVALFCSTTKPQILNPVMRATQFVVLGRSWGWLRLRPVDPIDG